MKKDLTDILVCPVCKGELSLSAHRADGDEVNSGALTCIDSGVEYNIQDGIPNLLPKPHTPAS